MAPSNQCSPGKLFTAASASIRIAGAVSPPRRTMVCSFGSVKSTQRSRIYIRLKLFGECEIGNLCDPSLLLSSWIPRCDLVEWNRTINRDETFLWQLLTLSSSHWLDFAFFHTARTHKFSIFLKKRLCDGKLTKIHRFNLEKCFWKNIGTKLSIIYRYTLSQSKPLLNIRFF